ncbi:unnamed protein product [Lactuca virosa]|uniref:Uncharacterized protein n=1 Tax=Lactuca virosa TaxID=75947 RepID=A0AAU9LNE5_9ASTR|nr:unnamed protein product [Lactuca virosa]
MVIGVKGMQKVIYGEQLDMGILVNNGRVAYPAAMFFHVFEEEVWKNVMKVNVIGTGLVTRVVIGGMVDRKRCVIVNIGLGPTIDVPSPLFYAIYDAIKA